MFTLQDGIYTGIVRAIQGTTPGPASGITYTVDVIDGGVTYPLEGMRPAVERWPDAIDVRAIEVGKPVDLRVIAGTVYMLTREIPDFGACP